MKRLLVGLALVVGAPLAQAAAPASDDGNHFYYTIGYTYLAAKLDYGFGNAKWDLGALSGTLAWQPIRYLAVEATGLAGVSDSTDQGVTLKLDSGYLASLVPMVPVSNSVALYGRIGYAHTSLSLKANGIAQASGSDHDTAYGLGIQFLQPYGSSQLGGRLEVTRFYNRDGLSIDGISLSFMQRF